jgi:hypothetical protein
VTDSAIVDGLTRASAIDRLAHSPIGHFHGRYERLHQIVMPAFLIHPSASASIRRARTALDDAYQQSRKRAATAKYVLDPC